MWSLQHDGLGAALGSESKLSSYKGESCMVLFADLVLKSHGVVSLIVQSRQRHKHTHYEGERTR